MTETATGDSPPTPDPDIAAGPAPALLAAAHRIAGIDAASAVTAQQGAGPGPGRLAELRGWLAGAQGTAAPRPPARVRLLVVGAGAADASALALADRLGIGVGTVGIGAVGTADGAAGGVDAALDAAVEAGCAAVEAEVESGADLLVLAGAPGDATRTAVAVVVAALRSVEPVALLPRGARAVDTAAWTRRALALREARRKAIAFAGRPLELLAAVGDPGLAAMCGALAAAAARRTPAVLDGVAALAAALLVHDLADAARSWWQAADACPDPVHARACRELAMTPLLDLGVDGPAALAGLLAVPLVRAAAELGSDGPAAS